MANSLTLRIGADLSALNARLKQAESRLKRFAFRAERIGRDLTTRVSLPIIGIGGAAVQAFAQLERAELGLAALNGSAKAGADQLQRLNKVVNDTKTTLDLKTAALAAQRLQGAGLSAQFAERLIKQLGIAANVSGGSVEGVGLAIRQFSQAVGKGKIEQEDLNSALENASALGPIIRKEYGATTAEAIRASGDSVEEFLEKLVSGAEQSEVFAGAQGGLAKSFEAFGNSVFVGIAPLGKAIADALNLEENLQRLGDAITSASQRFSELGQGTQRFIILTAAAAAAAGPLALGLGAVARSLPLLRSGFTLLPGLLGPTVKGFASLTAGVNAYGKAIITGTIPRNAALIKSMKGIRAAFAIATGPIGLAVAAIALVAISFKRAFDRSETFRNQLSKLAATFQPIINFVTTLASKIADKLGVNLGKVGDIFNVVFGGIAAGISFQISVFQGFADTVGAVFTAIKQATNFDFKAAGETLAGSLFNPANLAAAAKKAAEDAVKVFNETVTGESVSLLGSGGGGSGSSVAEEEPDPTGGGLGRSVQTVDALSASIGDLVGSYERANFAALAVAGTNERLASQASKFAITLTEGPLQKYSDTLQVIAEKTEVFGTSFDTVGAKINATKSTLNSLLEEGFSSYSSEVIFLQEQLSLLTDEQVRQNESTRIQAESLGLLNNALGTIGLSLEALGERSTNLTKVLQVTVASIAKVVGTAFDQMTKSGESFGRSLARATKSIVSSFIRQGVAAIVSKTLSKSAFFGPIAIPISLAVGAAASAGFESLLGKIPALAEGGIATGATLALIGEGSESEAILPLSKLQSLLDMNSGGGGGPVQFRIAGEDLVAVYDQGRARQNRIY